MRAGILTLHHLEMQGKCKKKYASTQKDKANLVSRQDRLDLFSDSMFHLENLDHWPKSVLSDALGKEIYVEVNQNHKMHKIKVREEL